MAGLWAGTVAVALLFAVNLYQLYNEGAILFARPDDPFYPEGAIMQGCGEGSSQFSIVRRFGYLVWFEEARIQYPESKE